MPHRSNWWSDLGLIKGWRQEWAELTRALAEIPDLCDDDLGCVAPDWTTPHTGRSDIAPGRSGTIDLLLLRMESLDLDAGRVRYCCPFTFCRLAESCLTCACKELCEQDLAYASAGILSPNGDNYCANGSTLNAMAAAPWFKLQRSVIASTVVDGQ
jgi:hypothetical protein